MSNKQQLQLNNEEVASLIEILRGKAAGGSGGGDLEVVTIISHIHSEPEMEICYIDNTLTYIRTEITSGAEYNVLKGSILVLLNYSSNEFDKCTYISGDGPCKAFLATG